MSNEASKDRRRWFLPESPDVIGMLQQQGALTLEGIRAFAQWAAGAYEQAQEVRDLEHECDDVRRKLAEAVREAFTTPLNPEDLFQLSMDLDKVMNEAKSTVRESEAMSFPPDHAIIEMSKHLVEGVEHLQVAFEFLDGKKDKSGTTATDAASAAVKSQRHLERVYRRAMTELMDTTDLKVILGSRELYRRVLAMSEDIVDVADRVWYCRVKES